MLQHRFREKASQQFHTTKVPQAKGRILTRRGKGKPLCRGAILAHLPEMLRTEERYRRRLKLLPEKYLFAILASETASSMVYRENREADFLGVLQGHLQRSFGEHIERKIA